MRLSSSFSSPYAAVAASAITGLVLGLNAMPVAGVSILESSYAQLHVQGHVISPAFSAEASQPLDPVDGRVDFGDPITFETLVATNFSTSGGQWFGFPPDVFRPDSTRAFSSATQNGAGTGAVGVSGWLQTINAGDTGTLFALSRFESDIRNVGDESDFVDATFQIPRIELVLGTSPDSATPFEWYGEGTGVFASVVVETFSAAGESLGTLSLFDYSLSLNSSRTEILVSSDILLDAADIVDATDLYLPGTTGIRVEPFEVTRTIGLHVGETAVYTYHMFATIQSFGQPLLDGTAGGHAYFGDPLDLLGGDRASFVLPGVDSVTPVTPVSLPAMPALVFCGWLVTVLAWCVRRRAAGTGPLSPGAGIT